MNELSRRTVLAGAASLALAACGSGATQAGSNTQAGGSTQAGGNGVKGAKGLVAIQFFKSQTLAAGQPARLPFGLGNDKGIVESGGPDVVGYRILDANGKQVQAPATAKRHAKDLTRPYWPVIVNLPAGTYQAVLSVNGTDLSPAAFDISAASELTIPKAGDKLRAFDTPTTADARGVNPICTRKPACPFHAMTLTEAMASGKPVVFIVATPAYCQTAICGPVLDVLIKQSPDRFAVVHSEVYTDSTLQATAPAVEAYGLTFEPCVFLAGRDGVITQRLDVIVDTDELSAALATLV